MQTYCSTETEGGLRLNVEIKDAQYRHFDAFARRKGGCQPSEVAQAMIDRHLEARAKGQVLVAISAENHHLACGIASIAHVPVEKVINAALGDLRELARWDDIQPLERLMRQWIENGTVPENEIKKAERCLENLKQFMADKDLLGVACNRNACKL